MYGGYLYKLEKWGMRWYRTETYEFTVLWNVHSNQVNSKKKTHRLCTDNAETDRQQNSYGNVHSTINAAALTIFIYCLIFIALFVRYTIHNTHAAYVSRWFWLSFVRLFGCRVYATQCIRSRRREAIYWKRLNVRNTFTWSMPSTYAHGTAHAYDGGRESDLVFLWINRLSF